MAAEASIISLTASLSCWEIAGHVSTAAIAAGCAGEAVHELTRWFRRYCWWDKNGGAASALLLIAAIAFEIPIQIKTSSISGQIIALLEKQTAETRLRAAELERTLESERAARVTLNKQLAPSVFTEKQNKEVVSTLVGRAVTLSIVFTQSPLIIRGAGEPEVYARELENAFRMAGCDVQGARPATNMVEANTSGIHLYKDRNREWVAILSALINAGITPYEISALSGFVDRLDHPLLIVGEKMPILGATQVSVPWSAYAAWAAPEVLDPSNKYLKRPVP
jgi:hypothetical protein